MKYSLIILAFLISIPVHCLSQTIDNESFTEMEGQILNIINGYRKSINLDELLYNKEIDGEAKKHSISMATGKTPFSHDGFDARFDRLMKLIGGSSMAENVALGQTTAQEAVDSWLDSQGHKENIEGRFNLTGIGIARGGDGDLYFTQIFLFK